MKNKFELISYIIMLVFGAAAILSFIVILASGDKILKWIPALIVAVVLVISGFNGIKNYFKN